VGPERLQLLDGDAGLALRQPRCEVQLVDWPGGGTPSTSNYFGATTSRLVTSS
jgi:hypothetical protein